MCFFMRILKREFSRLFHDSIDDLETVYESSPPVSANSLGDKNTEICYCEQIRKRLGAAAVAVDDLPGISRWKCFHEDDLTLQE